MEAQLIVEKVKFIIEDKLGVDERTITNDADLVKDLKADSLDAVELIMEFEKEFNITIPDSEMEKLKTVGQIIDYLKLNVKQ